LGARANGRQSANGHYPRETHGAISVTDISIRGISLQVCTSRYLWEGMWKRIRATFSGKGDEEGIDGPGSEIEGARNTRSFASQDLEDEGKLCCISKRGFR
jgi:hypothetical protein